MTNNLKTTTKTETKPCAECGQPVPSYCLICAGCTREHGIRFRKSHAHLYAKKGI